MAVWLVWLSMVSVVAAQSQCPWGRELSELQSACICAYNLGQELSVQCDMVDYSLLLKALDTHARSVELDLLYINNSTIKALEANAFSNLRLHNLQLSGCRIRTVSPEAFQGLETTLRNLNLQDNEIDEIPIESLRELKNLTLLDLSRNRITKVPDSAFVTLNRLSTLKLSDNNVTISSEAFQGLEESLKNLNLKGTRQKKIPEAVKGLKTLAFLDLAQNGLTELPGPGSSDLLLGLDALTALNLERNVIQKVADDTFVGVADTLSSLSLLNNLLTEFPVGAINTLTELRVLDIGFNLLTELPVDAFTGTPSLTLLALDGNPLASIPGAALVHLNTTLRGLSLGGRFLHCDCRLRWVSEWIRHNDLQVTSRERSPQFCGTPPRFRDRNFYTILPEELVCGNENTPVGVATVVNAELEEVLNNPSIIDEEEEEEDEATSTTKRPTTALTTKLTRPTTTTSTTTTTTSTTTTTTPEPTTTTTAQTFPPTTVRPTRAPVITTTRRGSVVVSRSTVPPWPPQQQRPLVLGHPKSVQEHRFGEPPSVKGVEVLAQKLMALLSETKIFPNVYNVTGCEPEDKTISNDTAHESVLVRSAHRQDNSVIIQWDSETANILGFRVVYRLFGDKSFKQGPPLEASEREFKIKNVPSQECIVVCVISLEEINVTPDTVPYGQCREVRTVSSPTSHMDKITIAASAAICGTVIIAVIVFVAASRRRSRKLHTLAGTKAGLPVPGLPVACCPASSPGPLSSLATLSAFTSHKDWDQVSVYSNRSLSRPRMYHMERQGSLTTPCMNDEMRYTGKPAKTRSVADGQSQHSFSNHSGRYLTSNAFSAGLVNSRPELRQSRQSLAVSERMSRVSYPSVATHTRQRSRSRSRDHTGSAVPRPGSRYSTAGSHYGDQDNWTDHDMDIYMARNTTRSGLVPL